MRRKERGKVGFCAHRQSMYSLHWGLESAAGKARGFPARAQCLTLDGWDQLTPTLLCHLGTGGKTKGWQIIRELEHAQSAPQEALWQHSELIVPFEPLKGKWAEYKQFAGVLTLLLLAIRNVAYLHSSAWHLESDYLNIQE